MRPASGRRAPPPPTPALRQTARRQSPPPKGTPAATNSPLPCTTANCAPAVPPRAPRAAQRQHGAGWRPSPRRTDWPAPLPPPPPIRQARSGHSKACRCVRNRGGVAGARHCAAVRTGSRQTGDACPPRAVKFAPQCMPKPPAARMPKRARRRPAPPWGIPSRMDTQGGGRRPTGRPPPPRKARDNTERRRARPWQGAGRFLRSAAGSTRPWP